MPKVIGIIGSRRRNTASDQHATIRAFDRVYEPGDTIVSGGCPRGGDHFAEYIAQTRHIPITIHRAHWDTLGRGAGFARNTDIARDADILIACVASDRAGGTEDTIRKFLKRKPPSALILC